MNALHSRAQLLSALCVGAALTASPLVFAQPARPAATPATAAAQPAGDEANRMTARQLAMEGVAAHGRADWPTVIERFERAEQLFHAPVHLRYLAIAYERSTPPNMVRAAETWQRLSQEQLAADAPEVFRTAVAEAQREFTRIDARIGHLVVEIPSNLSSPVVTLDGQPYPAESLNTVRFVEPGQHVLRAVVQGRPPFERQFNLGAGATERVQVSPPEAPPPPPPPPRTTTVLRPNPLRTVGIITAGVGGAVLLGGIITGVMASGEFSQLQTECPNMRCPTAQALSRRDSVDSLAGASTGMYVAGGVLVAAGVAMFFIGRPREETVTVAVGPRYAGLSVAF